MAAIEDGKRLQDVHIKAANHLLRLQFPKKAGFQCTLFPLKDGVSHESSAAAGSC